MLDGVCVHQIKSNQIKWHPLQSTHSTVEKYLPGAISNDQHCISTSPWISQFLPELHKQARVCTKCKCTNGWMVCNVSKAYTMPTGPSARTSPFPSTCAFSSSTRILLASFCLVFANGQISCDSRHTNPWLKTRESRTPIEVALFVVKRSLQWWWCHQHINVHINIEYMYIYIYMYVIVYTNVWNILCIHEKDLYSQQK